MSSHVKPPLDHRQVDMYLAQGRNDSVWEAIVERETGVRFYPYGDLMRDTIISGNHFQVMGSHGGPMVVARASRLGHLGQLGYEARRRDRGYQGGHFDRQHRVM